MFRRPDILNAIDLYHATCFGIYLSANVAWHGILNVGLYGDMLLHDTCHATTCRRINPHLESLENEALGERTYHKGKRLLHHAALK